MTGRALCLLPSMIGLLTNGSAYFGLAILAAALAVSLWVAPAPAWDLLRLRPRRRRSPGQGGWQTPAALVAGGVVVILARLLAGGQGAALAVVGLAVTATTTGVVRAGARRRAATATRREVAHGCQVLARLVAVGQIPAEALRLAAGDCLVLAEAAAMQSVGGDPVEVWRAGAHRPGCEGLVSLARAWQVSHATGATMARPLRDVAAALAAEESLSRVVAGELSAPRATGRLLAVLPVFGIALGFMIGGNPLHFLLDNWVGQLCLVVGVLLACAGVVWVERLAVRGALS